MLPFYFPISYDYLNQFPGIECFSATFDGEFCQIHFLFSLELLLVALLSEWAVLIGMLFPRFELTEQVAFIESSMVVESISF